MRAQLEQNRKYSETAYKRIHNGLCDYRDNLMQECVEWQKDRELIHSKINNLDGIIWLDVGGTHHIKTGQDILCSVQGTLL